LIRKKEKEDTFSPWRSSWPPIQFLTAFKVTEVVFIEKQHMIRATLKAV
jgi:hypothetical protein